MDKVTSSILVDYTGVPSIVYTQRISWYIALICEDYWKGSIKGKKMMHHLQNLNQSTLKDEEIKEDEYHA